MREQFRLARTLSELFKQEDKEREEEIIYPRTAKEKKVNLKKEK